MSFDETRFRADRKGKPKKTIKEESRLRKSHGLSNIYPIYWIRILELLKERKHREEDYKVHPDYYKKLERDFSDLRYKGIRQDDLNVELSERVGNSKLRSIDYRDLLDTMQISSKQYIHTGKDEKTSLRYQITLLGELALKEKNNESALIGFWGIFDKTQLPQKKKGTTRDLRR